MVSRLAVLILTLNEEKHIAECIDSASFCDEIIVIDSGSTDNTVSIAQNKRAKVVYHAMLDGFAAQRNFALTQTNADWVIFLDADERITPELAEEIKNAIAQGDFAYEMLRFNTVIGQEIKHGVFKPDWSLRLYQRDKITWTGTVHESAHVSCPIKRLQGKLLHFPYTSWEQYFPRFDKYTSMVAQKMYAEGKKSRITDVTFRPIWAFIKVYVLQSGWRDGRLGFILSMFHAFYTLVKYVKLGNHSL